MPYDLKNAGATYQHLVNKTLKPQIRRNVEVYVDDMMAKSLEERSHSQSLESICHLEEMPHKIESHQVLGKFIMIKIK